MNWEVLNACRREALRKRIYHWAITRLERAIFDLAVKCHVNVRSKILFNIVTQILLKLSQASRSFTDRLMALGRPIAERISMTAYNWGNREALMWAKDASYMIYLGLMTLPRNRGWMI
jgi:hypothetical protein